MFDMQLFMMVARKKLKIYWLHLGFDLLKMHARNRVIWYALLAAAMEGGVFQPKRSAVDKKPGGIISRKRLKGKSVKTNMWKMHS